MMEAMPMMMNITILSLITFQPSEKWFYHLSPERKMVQQNPPLAIFVKTTPRRRRGSFSAEPSRDEGEGGSAFEPFLQASVIEC